MDESGIIRKIAAGDTDALRELYDKYLKDVYRFIFAMTKSPETAEDLTHDVFLTVAQKADTYRKNISVKSWLMTIARNKTLNHIKRESRLLPLEMDPPGKACGADSNLNFMAYLDTLTQSQRQIVILHVAYGFSHRETAQIMDMSHGAVRKQYERAIDALKSTFKEDEING